MTTPDLHTAPPFHFQQAKDPAMYHALPQHRSVVNTDLDTRIEMPFAVTFENLVYVGLVKRDAWHVLPHAHEHFELCYVDKGYGWFAIDDYVYPVQRGDLFVTLPREIHQGAAATDAPFSLYYLGFQLDHTHTLEMDYYRMQPQRVAGEQTAMVHDLFEHMLNELSGARAYALEMVQAHFLHLLVHVIRTYQQATHTASSEEMHMFGPVTRALLPLLHSGNNWHTVDVLVKQLPWSRSHVMRAFKHDMGISLGQYIRMLTLDYARMYLRDTNDSISTIARRLHFPSIHTFSIFFKRNTGQAPVEYREQLRAALQDPSRNQVRVRK